ncbi:MAG: malate dehydrogenase [Chlamydiales bacterium]|nr:malate dehydrogenase [Chlamydiales bacterium]MCH9636023.1 malate dehydrogenase [Chlamydiales bacterium]MCH9703595.1 malate dehydrogenase [Chlamydiota bacterium]
MKKSPIHIAITGACGQIAYSLIFRIASGQLFDEPVFLHLQDLPGMEEKLEGIAMELSDCAFEQLAGFNYSTDLHEVFDSVDLAILVGAKPRSKGMERKDLLAENGKIFVGQGRALDEAAKKDAVVYVVGNPANTNALVAMHNAPSLKRENFHALMRLDQNRARALMADRAGVAVADVKKLSVWGNHSVTQVPDYNLATLSGRPAVEVVTDSDWLEGEFMQRVQKRGASVIEKLGRSSAASAANATLDAIASLYRASGDDYFSSAICSDGNPYGIREGLIFGFPCQSKGDGSCEIVSGLPFGPGILERIKRSEKELLEEMEFCKKEGLI